MPEYFDQNELTYRTDTIELTYCTPINATTEEEVEHDEAL